MLPYNILSKRHACVTVFYVELMASVYLIDDKHPF